MIDGEILADNTPTTLATKFWTLNPKHRPVREVWKTNLFDDRFAIVGWPIVNLSNATR